MTKVSKRQGSRSTTPTRIHSAVEAEQRPLDATRATPRRIGPYVVTGVLGRGGMGVVYKARHETEDYQVAVKTVGAASWAAPAAIRQEISILYAMHHPGIVRIVDADARSGEPWYAMELLEGETLEGRLQEVHRREGHSAALQKGGTFAPSYAGAGRLDELLLLIVKLCEPLAFLHSAGIVHGDIKPANVFLRDGTEPVLVDFGLISLTRGVDGRERLHVAAAVAGTAPYLAPEVIAGRVPDARADLYALGCLLYEAVTGHPPFEAANVESLLEQHVSTPLMAASSRVAHVPPALDALLEKLLVKDPRQRIGHAQDVAVALTPLLARPRPLALQSLRTSHLFRPQMVGRSRELVRLFELCANAIEGRGGFALIAGESGIGKSFLTTELCKHAALGGMRVLTNECLPLTAASSHLLGAPPLYALRRVLEAVHDACRADGRAETLRLLGPSLRLFAQYEPSLLTLEGALETPEPAALPAFDARKRFVRAFGDVLRALAEREPLLIAIDDLQWADDLSLAVLEELDQSFLETAPIAIVAAYRSDETAPALMRLAAKPWLQRLELQRLPSEEVSQLVGGMLALERPPQDLVDYVAAQAEGVPFVAAEYLRAVVADGVLMREHGRWRLNVGEHDAAATLSAVTFPNRIAELVRRRVARLPLDDVAVLEMAAVIGRTFERSVLASALVRTPEALKVLLDDFETRQLIAANGPEQYRFLHDKIREVIYSDLGPARRCELHFAVGLAIQACLEPSSDANASPYAYAPQPTGRYGLVQAQRYYELAHHFRGAQDFERALNYFEKAAEYALRLSALGDAAASLREALRLAAAVQVPPTRLRRARWERMLADALQGVGSVVESEAPLLRAAHWLGRPFPDYVLGGLGLSAQLVCEVAQQAWYLVRRSDDADHSETMTELSRVYERLQRVYYVQGRSIALLLTNVAALNIRGVTTTEQTLAYGYAAVIVDFALPSTSLAEYYMRVARQRLQRWPDAATESQLSTLSALYHLGHGRFDACVDDADQAIAIARRAGYFRRVVEALAIRAFLELVRGRHETGRRFTDELASLVVQSEDVQVRVWMLVQRAYLHQYANDWEATANCLHSVAGLEHTLCLTDRIVLHSFSAYAEHRRGRYELARKHVLLTFSLVGNALPNHLSCIEAYSKLVEVMLAFYAQARGVVEQRYARSQACRACKRLLEAAARFPLLQSVARLHAGTWHWLSGRKAKARRLWRAGLAAAQRIGLPYEEARLHHALSFGLSENSGEHRRSRERIHALEASLAIVPIPAARAFECMASADN